MNTKTPTLKATCPICGKSVTVFQAEGSIYRWLVQHFIPKRRSRCRGSLMHVNDATAPKAASQ